MRGDKMKRKGIGMALHGTTLLALWRRRGMCLILAAVVALSTFVCIALQNLTQRQECALDSLMEDIRIRCVLTDTQGTRVQNLGLFSSFVEMLMGMRHIRGCYADEYVKNVRAKAVMPLTQPVDARLCRILSFDSDPGLSDLEGTKITLDRGWSEAVFGSRELACVVTGDIQTELAADGTKVVTVSANDSSEVQLQVIGTVSGEATKTIYCPFFIDADEALGGAFPIDSCSFDIRDNRRLEECKAGIYAYFVEPSLSNQPDSLQAGVLVQDETFLNTVEEIKSNLSMLRLLLPLLTAFTGGIGFFGSYLVTRGRVREFAVMRCLGFKRRAVFGLVLEEQAVLAVAGLLVGAMGGFFLEGNLSGVALLRVVSMGAIFLVGSAVAALRVACVNVMKLMKAEE